MYRELVPKFDIQLLSMELGERYFNSFFIPSLKNQSIRFYTAPGLGDFSHLAYLSRQINLFPEFSKRVFMNLDIRSFLLDQDTALQAAISSIKVPSETKGILFDILAKLTFEKGYGVTLILNNMEEVFNQSHEKNARTAALNFLETIRKINPMSISFIMLLQQLPSKKLDLEAGLFKNFDESKELFKEAFPFDEESFDISIRNREGWWSKDFSSAFISDLKNFSMRDPSVIKQLLEDYRSGVVSYGSSQCNFARKY